MMAETSTRLKWTRFADWAASSKREVQHTWSELADHIRHTGPYPAKSLCPWLKLATFGDRRTLKGALRNSANVLEITGVEGDYDGEVISPVQAVEMLERAQIRAIVYTSPSHTPAKPRWRVLAPLSHPFQPGARNALLARVNGALDGILTAESFRLSQSYYYGRVEGQAEYMVLHTFDDADDGMFVDELDDLDEIARMHQAVADDADDAIPVKTDIAATVERLGRKLRTGDGRRELLKQYIGKKSSRGLNAEEVRALVAHVADNYFDPSDPIDWSNINEIINDITAGDETQRVADAENAAGLLTVSAQEPANQPSGLPILNPAQLREAAGSITWSVKHVIPSDSVGIMFGGSGTFKSFIALDFALHTVHGLSWLGKKTKKGPVLFIAAEGGAGLWNRVHAWHKERGLSWDGIEFYVIPVAVALSSNAGAVVQAAQSIGVHPSAVIVDTMSQTFEGEENSSNEVASYLRVIGNQFRGLWRCVVLIIHHSGHSATERPRGSSAIRANVDFMLGVFRDEKQMLATMEVHKQKDGELLSDMTFDLNSVLLRHDEDGEAITSLVATHINDATGLLEAMKREGGAGRGGRNMLLLGLVQQGMTEKELRKAFYEDLADVTDIDKKKVAFYRARDWAMKSGFFEIAGDDRRIIVLKEWK